MADIDVLKEKTELYTTQKKRVMLDVEIESRLRKTFPTLSQDVRLLNEILDDVQRLQEEGGTVKSAVVTEFSTLPTGRRKHG